jgi:hypothetical protein
VRATVAGMLMLGGCGLHQMMPEGPVLTDWERDRAFTSAESKAHYVTRETPLPYPILPLAVFGVAYDLDLVIVDRKSAFDMHEYAKLTTPDGPLWLAKDARVGSLEQTVVADVPSIESWLPELPIARKSAPVKVDDRSTDDRLDLSLSYDNIDGQPTEVEYSGPPPETAESKRNGSTMGHSRDALLAVLDLPYRAFGKHAKIRIDGEDQGIRKLAGILPFRMALIQTQAGLAVGSYRLEPVVIPDLGYGTGEFTMIHHLPSGDLAEPWRLDVFRQDRYDLVQDAPLRQIRASFVVAGAALELAEVTITQFGRANPVCHLELSPALPDLRMKFNDHVRSRYVIDVDGQENHATGWLDAWWDDAGSHVAVQPDAPWWTVDRPMQADIVIVGGNTEVAIHRVATDAKSGTGAKNRSPVTASEARSSP